MVVQGNQGWVCFQQGQIPHDLLKCLGKCSHHFGQSVTVLQQPNKKVKKCIDASSVIFNWELNFDYIHVEQTVRQHIFFLDNEKDNKKQRNCEGKIGTQTITALICFKTDFSVCMFNFVDGRTTATS